MSSRSISETTLSSLLGSNDPAPMTVLNAAGRSNAVIVCDHGGAAIPNSLQGLGLDGAQRARHITWDIGAADVARALSIRLDAPAILAEFSRLVIDLNRPPDDLTSIREISDGVLIKGNRNLSPKETADRIDLIFNAYHDAVSAAIEQAKERVAAPVLISVHSFTPVMKGYERPWHIGVLFGPDCRIARPLIQSLAQNPEICVGENKPYSGYDLYGYTVETHAMPKGYPNVLFEIRQDLIDTRHGAEHWAGLIGQSLSDVLENEELYQPFLPE